MTSDLAATLERRNFHDPIATWLADDPEWSTTPRASRSSTTTLRAYGQAAQDETVILKRQVTALVAATVTGFAAVTNTGLASAVASHRAAPPVGMQLAELTGSGTVAWDWFGASVAVSGGTIVVGAPAAPLLSSGVGRAYAFTKTPTGWHQSAQFVSP